MKHRQYLLGLFITGILSWPALAASSEQMVKVDWDKKEIIVVGTGQAPADIPELEKRQTLAQQAALADAYQRLRQIVYHLKLEDKDTVEGYLKHHPLLALSISGTLLQAQTREVHHEPNQTWLTLVYPFKNLQGALLRIESPTVPEQDLTNLPEGASIDWKTRTLYVTGKGKYPEKGTQRMKQQMARRAAMADAYRQIIGIVQGVKTDREITVDALGQEHEYIIKSVSGSVQGAREMGIKYEEEWAYVEVAYFLENLVKALRHSRPLEIPQQAIK